MAAGSQNLKKVVVAGWLIPLSFRAKRGNLPVLHDVLVGSWCVCFALLAPSERGAVCVS